MTYFPIVIPLWRVPTNSMAKDMPMLYENSPASVLMIFPPHTELASMKRKKREKKGPADGNGERLPQQAKRGVYGQGKRKDAPHCHHLERSLQRNQTRECGHGQKGEGKIEQQNRKSGIVAHGPAGNLSLWKEDVMQILKSVVMRSRVAAGGGSFGR